MTARETLARQIEAADKKAWQRGYLIAVSTMLHQHGCTVTAKDAILDSGITWAEVRKQDFDAFDLDMLRPIYDEINANRRWHRREQRRAAVRAGGE